MAKKITPLTDVQIRKAKPEPNPYKLSYGGGFYLLVMISGGKSWRLDFKYEGKRDTLQKRTDKRSVSFHAIPS